MSAITLLVAGWRGEGSVSKYRLQKRLCKKKRHNFNSYASRDVVWRAQVLVIPDEGLRYQQTTSLLLFTLPQATRSVCIMAALTMVDAADFDCFNG